MGKSIVVFEDERVSRLYPLTLTRPVFDLVCGSVSLGGKLLAVLGKESAGAQVRFHARDYLTTANVASAGRGFVASHDDVWRGQDIVTFVNGRLLAADGLFKQVDFSWVGKYLAGDAVAVANLPRERAERLAGCIGTALGDEAFADLPWRRFEGTLVCYPWDLLRRNAEEIANDFRRSGGCGIDSDLGPGVHLVNQAAIRVAKGVALSPGVVLDATDGPVNIESGVEVMANAGLCGPLHLGAGSLVKMGATIYGGTSIGPVSKIGGEVAVTVVLGHSNKQHGGFLGHSYLGEWVNIGAGTNTSDLKNNYSTVRVDVGGETVDSGELFLGLVMGDHSKSGIGSIFNTGTTVGVCSNVFGADYPPKAIPSFAWGGASGFVEHKLGAALETARRVVARRGMKLDAVGESVLRKVFEITADERSAFLKR